jgi:hypothetical protein
VAPTIAKEINNPLEAMTKPALSVRTSTHDPGARQYVIAKEEEVVRVSQIVFQSLKFQSTSPNWEMDVQTLGLSSSSLQISY